MAYVKGFCLFLDNLFNWLILGIIGIILGLALLYLFYENPNLDHWKYVIYICSTINFAYAVPAVVMSTIPLLDRSYSIILGWICISTGALIADLLTFSLSFTKIFRNIYGPAMIGITSGFFFIDSIEMFWFYKLPTT